MGDCSAAFEFSIRRAKQVIARHIKIVKLDPRFSQPCRKLPCLLQAHALSWSTWRTTVLGVTLAKCLLLPCVFHQAGPGKFHGRKNQSRRELWTGLSILYSIQFTVRGCTWTKAKCSLDIRSPTWFILDRRLDRRRNLIADEPKATLRLPL